MNEHDGSKPPAGWLKQLHEAGHWSRLIEMARRSLAADPNDPDTHRHIAWAYAMCSRYPEMWPHVSFLLNTEPNEPRNHHLAAIYHLDTNQQGKAQSHVELLLRNNPNSATYHYLACILALRCNSPDGARNHIQRARALSPHWAAAAHLEIKMDGARQKKASQAWARVRRLKETLSLDPRNSDVMITIGDILLTELEQPRAAEEFFRDALLIDPTNKTTQQKFFDAVRARSLFYRTLTMPSSALRNLKAGYKRKIPLLFRLLAVLFVLHIASLFIAWFVIVGAFFSPAAFIYEWLVLTDITQTRTGSRVLAPLRMARPRPLWLRVSIALTLIIGAWLLLLWKVFGVQPTMALEIMAFTFGAHLALLGLFVGIRRLRARIGYWQEARRLKREGSAVQPEMA